MTSTTTAPLTREHVESVVVKAHRIKRREPLRPAGKFTWALSYRGSAKIIEVYETLDRAREIAQMNTLGEPLTLWKRTGPRTWTKHSETHSITELFHEILDMGTAPEEPGLDRSEGPHMILRVIHEAQDEAEGEGEPTTAA